MTVLEAMEARHSVRQYLDRPLDRETEAALRAEIDACNREGGLRMQLVTNEPRAFSGVMAHYGSFSGVSSYLALVGKRGPGLDERCGYYGERVVLRAQMLGLNTCWVALTYRRVPAVLSIPRGEKLLLVISLGYGATQGKPRASKPASAVSCAPDDAPAWFRAGVEAALLAPTATNQQQFFLTYRDGGVEAKALPGFYAKTDLGIVKYHFELGAGRENVRWI